MRKNGDDDDNNSFIYSCTVSFCTQFIHQYDMGEQYYGIRMVVVHSLYT